MISREALSWLAKNATKLEARLKIHRQNICYPEIPTATSLLLSDEMLCGAIPSMSFPPGAITTSLWVTSPYKSGRTPHNIALLDRTIIDPVAGQFYSDEDTNRSGIAMMMSIAPSLFIRLTSQLVVMCATFPEAKSELGLEYSYK